MLREGYLASFAGDRRVYGIGNILGKSFTSPFNSKTVKNPFFPTQGMTSGAFIRPNLALANGSRRLCAFVLIHIFRNVRFSEQVTISLD